MCIIGASVVTGNQSGGGSLWGHWERPGTITPGCNPKNPKCMSLPVISIQFGTNVIRITGLPDEPKFVEADILKIITAETSGLKRDLEVFEVDVKGEETRVLSPAGVYRLIFSAEEVPRAEVLESFFVYEVEPALRKYGFPYGVKPHDHN